MPTHTHTHTCRVPLKLCFHAVSSLRSVRAAPLSSSPNNHPTKHSRCLYRGGRRVSPMLPTWGPVHVVTHGVSDPLQLYKGETGTSLKPGNPPASADRILKRSLLCTPDRWYGHPKTLSKAFFSPFPTQRQVPLAVPAAPMADQHPSELTPFCSTCIWAALVGLQSETSFAGSKRYSLRRILTPARTGPGKAAQ